MDQPRKLFLFFALSLGFMILWSNLVMPHFLPPKKKKVAGDEVAQVDDEKLPGDDSVDGGDESDSDAADVNKAVGDNVAQADVDATPSDDTELTEPQQTSPVIGSLDPKTGYFLQVTLDSRGASIGAIEFSDPQFKELDRSKQLQILGDSPTEYRTFSTAVDLIDAVLKKNGKTLEEWNWELLEDQTQQADGVNSSVVFRVEAAGLEVRKKYSLQRAAAAGAESPADKTTAIQGYLIDCEITFVNKADKDQELVYQLQGPVGVRLENEQHSRENRKLQVAFVGDEDADDDSIMAGKVYSMFEDDEVETWTSRFRYVGVDNPYFGTLIIADPEQQTIGEIKPMLIDSNDKKPDLSDISLRLKSMPATIPASQPITHKFQFFAGPKYRELFDQQPLEASKVLNLGFFGFIARGMLNLLSFFKSLGLPYGLAIICLTILVRGCMFPLSRKQALSAQKMKELQPEIQALKDKYGDEKEKFAKAQMELFAKAKYNPFAGCLPLVFQFPIFIGLYTALYSAIDLRLSKFLWIDNLAAPDATFGTLPFSLPFLGREVSVLPIVTVFLFLAQQKLFMPEPTSDEQRVQFKMMNFMTIAFGFFFWHSPAGLCLYFIASSLWGITERKLLARMSEKKKESGEGIAESSMEDKVSNVKSRENEPKEDRKPGFFERKLKELTDAAAAANETGTQTRSANKDRRGKKKKRR